jgi:hypothetical protein
MAATLFLFQYKTAQIKTIIAIIIPAITPAPIAASL